MDLFKIVLGGFVGTGLMTLFSYLCGLILSKEFGEPKLLNKLFDRSTAWGAEVGENSPIGWIIHVLIGVLFAWIMYVFFDLTDCPYSWWAGSLLGSGFGILGVLGWMVLLNLHRSPPKVELPEFYLQLVVAHIVFGWGTVLIFKMFEGWLEVKSA